MATPGTLTSCILTKGMSSHWSRCCLYGILYLTTWIFTQLFSGFYKLFWVACCHTYIIVSKPASFRLALAYLWAVSSWGQRPCCNFIWFWISDLPKHLLDQRGTNWSLISVVGDWGTSLYLHTYLICFYKVKQLQLEGLEQTHLWILGHKDYYLGC